MLLMFPSILAILNLSYLEDVYASTIIVTRPSIVFHLQPDVNPAMPPTGNACHAIPRRLSLVIYEVT